MPLNTLTYMKAEDAISSTPCINTGWWSKMLVHLHLFFTLREEQQVTVVDAANAVEAKVSCWCEQLSFTGKPFVACATRTMWGFGKPTRFCNQVSISVVQHLQNECAHFGHTDSNHV